MVASSLAQQYPFVHYTPKDGLISNQVRNIYQDSKGRLYFTSVNGLSVYDGSRFINYTSRNGLAFDIVNCVMEMGDDSVWVMTNTNKINCLVKGQLKTLVLKETAIPVINQLVKDKKGVLYAATDQGLYFFDKDRFVKLPFIDTKGNDINTLISRIYSFGDHLLVQRDNSTLSDQREPLYLYNKLSKKITAEADNIHATAVAQDGRIWVSTKKNIMSVDTTALKRDKIILQELPGTFEKLKNAGGHFIYFDREGNCWLGDQSTVLVKAARDGNTTSFTTGSGLNMPYIEYIFLDREGITWIATNNAGVNKLVHSDFSFIENPFGISTVNDISYYENKDRLLLYSFKNAGGAIVSDNKEVQQYKVNNANDIGLLIETPHEIFGISGKNLYKMVLTGNSFYHEKIFNDSTGFSSSLVDKHGNLILCGKYQLTAIVNGNIISRKKLNLFADHAALDSKGNIWVATREQELSMYQPVPEDPSNYLEQKRIFRIEVSGFSPRSVIVDKHDQVWIGSRSHGIHVFSVQPEGLKEVFVMNNGSGLSDNFIHHLSCDADNNIWASSASGLDKISIKNGIPVIENLTRQNNIYQKVLKTVIDKNRTVWGLLTNGLIRITKENKKNIGYTPTLMVSMLKTGKDTISTMSGTSLSYKQNNLNFYLAATSFLDEKSVQYSYRLQGGSNTQWSDPSNNASVSFVDLNPGNYTLHIKAGFPAGRYPEQLIHYSFSIAPPWWQTWWFRIIMAIMIIGLLIMGFRFYFRKRLEKQMAALEKQQAVEKERTRIATDMHDDLGAGLSRIKFLSETISIKEQQHEPIEDDISKIRSYSHEMIDKMGEIVWALNEKNDTLSDLLSYTRAYAVEYLSQNNIECRVAFPDSIPSFFVSGEFRRNVFLTVKEALHNVVKHANATEVKFSVSVDQQLSIRLIDNGKGFDKNNTRSFSNGLANMGSRMKEIGGLFEIMNKEGTIISMVIPLKG
jgi:signal transduction histidine kinase/ligand-binding sensor domain-containing protein